jgi:hypothetical protein
VVQVGRKERFIWGGMAVEGETWPEEVGRTENFGGPCGEAEGSVVAGLKGEGGGFGYVAVECN